MNLADSFQEVSYQKHTNSFVEYEQDGIKAEQAKSWFDNDSVDAWRHNRMYQILDPIIEEEAQSTWVTVGDGRYGKDAKYILNKGSEATATDISESLLIEANKLGYISKYKKENAEALSFSDASFDYAFCKEAYHHFPRPMVALYEMLRVADKAVVLIEPNDPYINDKYIHVVSRKMKNIIKFFLGKNIAKHRYEESGNYVFSISRREIQKVALGLNYNMLAFKGLNDSYVFGVEYEKLSDNGPLQKKVKRMIGVSDFLCKLGIMDYSLLGAIIFKNMPSNKLMARLQRDGYEIVELPNNPYAND